VSPDPVSPDWLYLFRDKLDRHTASALSDWAASVHVDLGPRGDESLWQDRAAQRLMGSRLELVGPNGDHALTALERLGVFPPLARATLDVLAGPAQTRPLQNTELLYIGHPTRAMLPLVPTLETLGLARASAVFGPNSGAGAASIAIEQQMQASGGDVEWTPIEGGEPPWIVAAMHADAVVAAITRHAREAAARRHNLVVDKGGLIASHLTPELEQYIRDGTLRFVVHNSDDLKAFGPLAEEAWAVDLASSRIKALEAELIGQGFALYGAREVRQYWSTTVPSVDVYVVGAGLLGQVVLDGLRTLGLSPERITVVEKDDSLRRKARRADMKALSPEQLVSRKRRSARALVYVASDGASVDEANAAAFGDEALIIGVTSAGKGVDMKGLRERHLAAEPASIRFGGRTPRTVYQTWRDWRFKLGEGERRSEVIVIADALPLNLLDDNWPDRFAVTSSAVALATYAAGQLTGPGLHPLPREAEDEILEQAHSLGLTQPRPLDPPLTDVIGFTRGELQRDQESFAEPATTVGSFAVRPTPLDVSDLRIELAREQLRLTPVIAPRNDARWTAHEVGSSPGHG
jgi:hypothetical protein